MDLPEDSPEDFTGGFSDHPGPVNDGGVYLLDGRTLFAPGNGSVRCVTRNTSGLRCVAKLAFLDDDVMLALPTPEGLLWVIATRVPDHLTAQYTAQHCTRHHTTTEPVRDDIPATWEPYDPQHNPDHAHHAHPVPLTPGQWQPLPFDRPRHP
ncbi:hypothetical protein [Streptacidiphilus sp. EB103A]|uniref:hypothetical protein n=1 Tax=Streptacidiphilus sp. EB103A TaxID=3156275 RepID=UPI00351695CE